MHRLKRIEAICSCTDQHPRNLGVPVRFLYVLLSAMYEQ